MADDEGRIPSREAEESRLQLLRERKARQRLVTSFVLLVTLLLVAIPLVIVYIALLIRLFQAFA